MIQVLRAVAANMVLLAHIWGIEQKYHPQAVALPSYFKWSGWHGVYLFFVISGFVIIQAAEREDWRRFLTARVTRIYPTYWFYTAVFLAGYLAAPHLFAPRPDVSILASFALWPTAERPLLSVGWTLIHEMYFYVVVAAMLAAGLRPLYTLLAWAIVIIAAQLLPYDATPLSAVVFSPLTLLFIFGAGLGLVVGSTKSQNQSPFCLTRIAVALGDASYSTYLAHVLVVSSIWRLSLALPWQTSPWVLIAISVVAANVWGLLSYRFIERPLMAAVGQLANPSRYAAVR